MDGISGNYPTHGIYMELQKIVGRSGYDLVVVEGIGDALLAEMNGIDANVDVFDSFGLRC